MTESFAATNEPSAPSHHVVIAGTGRAGTSFLVRFLGACGLEVGSNNQWIPHARAGLEHYLLDEGAPYVVKDPWFFAYCSGVDPARIAVDALIVPIRELMAAATSRMLQERIALAESGWHNRPVAEVRGGASGGAIYSLDPVDQARILAVGFHQLIHWATANGIPLYLLEFPRMVEDGDRLISTLWPLLETHCTEEEARNAFEATADPSAVRVATAGSPEQGSGTPSSERDLVNARLDRDAMAALLDERSNSSRDRLSDLEDRLANAVQDLGEAQRRMVETTGILDETQSRLVATEQHLHECQGRSSASEETLRDAHGRLAEAEQQLSETLSRLSATEQALGNTQGHLAHVEAERQALHRTVSWRVTRPLRAIRSVSRGQVPLPSDPDTSDSASMPAPRP